jgi:hypothetical protein
VLAPELEGAPRSVLRQAAHEGDGGSQLGQFAPAIGAGAQVGRDGGALVAVERVVEVRAHGVDVEVLPHVETVGSARTRHVRLCVGRVVPGRRLVHHHRTG